MDPHRGGNPSRCIGSTPTEQIRGHETKKQTRQDLEVELLRARGEGRQFLRKLKNAKRLGAKTP